MSHEMLTTFGGCMTSQSRIGRRSKILRQNFASANLRQQICAIWRHINSIFPGNPSSMPREGEVVDAPFRANRRLMFVMRRFLYISISIQMLLYCIFRFVVRYTFPYWASWMICSGFGVQTIALILLLAILPEIRVYARRKFFCEWMDPDRPRDHGHFTKNPNSWLTEFINFTELHNLEACIR